MQKTATPTHASQGIPTAFPFSLTPCSVFATWREADGKRLAPTLPMPEVTL